MTAATSRSVETTNPKVVLSGTFRRDHNGLLDDYEALSAAGCDILSPRDPNFIGEREGFAYAQHEEDQPAGAIEEGHLNAILRADFVWLYAPEGYVGPSGAMEVGFANANGVPVFTRSMLNDQTLASLIEVVDSPTVALHNLRSSPPVPPLASLATLQAYYSRIALSRGYTNESPQDCMLLLTEEVGELARAIRMHVGLVRQHGYEGEGAFLELADVQLYLVHLANILGVDLRAAVAEKERRNAARAEPGPALRTA